jgi:hypothetical protein
MFEQGAWSRELGAGSLEQGAGSLELGAWRRCFFWVGVVRG